MMTMGTLDAIRTYNDRNGTTLPRTLNTQAERITRLGHNTPAPITTGHNGERCNQVCCSGGGHAVTRKHDDFTTPAHNDARTPAQRDLMLSLTQQLMELDEALGVAADAYIKKMTDNLKWTPGREGNASAWIGRMIEKVRELKAADRAAAPVKAGFDSYDDIPTGYYALVGTEGPDDIKFYRVNHHKASGRLYVDACASDERHPVRVWATRKAILDGIRSMGWQASTALYGSKIGSCGRCHRTLTDADSRARGIGPDCWGKM